MAGKSLLIDTTLAKMNQILGWFVSGLELVSYRAVNIFSEKKIFRLHGSGSKFDKVKHYKNTLYLQFKAENIKKKT